jgi:uncharacterized phosphosugar-binding protein
VNIDQKTFVAGAQPVIDKLVASQGEPIRTAGRLLADVVRRDGVIQVFGTGHSQALAMELAGRAGGFVPTNRLSVHDAQPSDWDDTKPFGRVAERDPAVAERLYKVTGVQPSDGFVIASNSGINGAVVEMALLAKRRGHQLVAFTSLTHAQAVESRHPSGRKLHEVADVVVDNCAPPGDTLIPIGGDVAVGAISSITSALAAQMMVAEAVGALLATGHTPPIYRSTNVPGGDAHNQALEARYSGRLRRGHR